FALSRYKEKCREIIIRHGFDKILFATDYPWSSAKFFIEIIKSYGFSQEETDKIFYKNALKLLSAEV
ncbi:MAG: amidohydrolase, partial [Clostridia bacterium]|nr:amidohydrolase [Clostridia bacterium]